MQQKGLHRGDEQLLPAGAPTLISLEAAAACVSWCIVPAERGVLLLRLLLRVACDMRAHALSADPPLARFIDDSVLVPLLATGTLRSLLCGLQTQSEPVTVIENMMSGSVSLGMLSVVWDILQVSALLCQGHMQM